LADYERSDERGCDVPVLLQQSIGPLIKARQYVIIGMQDMDKMPQRSLQTGIEIADNSNIRGLTKKGNAPLADISNHRLGIIIGRTIVNYLDLHLIDTWILRQDRFKCVLEKVRTVVDRDHYRPAWPPDTRQYWINYWYS
jgi:hypothetical protein